MNLFLSVLRNSTCYWTRYKMGNRKWDKHGDLSWMPIHILYIQHNIKINASQTIVCSISHAKSLHYLTVMNSEVYIWGNSQFHAKVYKVIWSINMQVCVCFLFMYFYNLFVFIYFFNLKSYCYAALKVCLVHLKCKVVLIGSFDICVSQQSREVILMLNFRLLIKSCFTICTLHTQTYTLSNHHQQSA